MGDTQVTTETEPTNNPQDEIIYVLPHANQPDEEDQREVDSEGPLQNDNMSSLDEDELECIVNWLNGFLSKLTAEPQVILAYHPLRNLIGTYLPDIIKEIGYYDYGLDDSAGVITDDLEALRALAEGYNSSISPEVLSRLIEVEQLHTSLILMMLEPSLRGSPLPLDSQTMSRLLNKYSQKAASYFIPYSTGGFILEIQPFEIAHLLHGGQMPSLEYPLKGLKISAVAALKGEKEKYQKICQDRGITFEAEGKTYMKYSAEAMQHRWGIQIDDQYLSAQSVGRENAFISWKESPFESGSFEIIVVDPETKRRVRSFVYAFSIDPENGKGRSELMAQTISEYSDGPPADEPEESPCTWSEWTYQFDELHGWQAMKCVMRHVSLNGIDLMVIRKRYQRGQMEAIGDENGRVVALVETEYQLYDGHHTVALAVENGGFMVPVNFRSPVTERSSEEILKEVRPAIWLLPKGFPY